MDMWDHMDGGWWVGGMIMMVLFWGALIALGVWAVQVLAKRESPHDDEPLAIAEKRYARGEINREEFDQIRRDVTGPRRTPA